MRVLLIEDDKDVANTVTQILESEGHFCDVITSGEDYTNSFVVINSSSYDLVILDIHLPGEVDGYDILVKIRNAKIKVAVLILSCLSSDAQISKGLHFGADDWITKPVFSKTTFLSRINAIVRRTKGFSESLVRVGSLVVNFEHRVVEVAGKVIHLTNKEYGIMELLATRKGTVLTKEMFLNHLYNGNDEPGDNKIIDVFMCKLRKKLVKASGGINYIETIWGRGYVLKDSHQAYTTSGSDVEFIEAEEASSSSDQSAAVTTDMQYEEGGMQGTMA